MDDTPPPPAPQDRAPEQGPEHPPEQPRSRRGTLPAFNPVPRLKDRSNGWKPHIQRAFIEALADSGSVASACRTVRRSTHGAYHLRRQPGAEEFAAAWEAALDCGMQRIEDVAMERALNGVEVPVYSYGKLVGTRIVHNDRLLMFLLRNRAPHRFAEGRAKAMNAIDRMELARLRKQWRQQWEAEQRRVSPAEVRASIERKVEVFRSAQRARERRDWARLSAEAREAFVAYTQLRARDLGGALEVPHFLQEAEGDAPRENWWDAPEAWREEERWLFGAGVEEREEVALPPPAREESEGEAVEEAPEEATSRLRSLRDEGWR